MNRSKKLLAFILTFALGISMLWTDFGIKANAEKPNTITVTLRVEGTEKTVANTLLHLTQEDLKTAKDVFFPSEPASDTVSPTVALALASYAVKTYGNEASEKVSIVPSSYGGYYVQEIEGITSLSYRCNNASAGSVDTQAVGDGDEIVFYQSDCYDPSAGDWGAYTDYCFFENSCYTSAAGQPTTLTLQRENGYDDNYMPIITTAPGESIIIKNAAGETVSTEITDEAGKISVTLDQNGIYTATSQHINETGLAVLSRAFAIITVNEPGQAANVTQAKTPLAGHTGGPKWKQHFAANGETTYLSDPVITDSYIYLVCKNTLYRLDKNGTIQNHLTLPASMNSVCRMKGRQGRLYIPLANGCLTCVDAETMTILWKTDTWEILSASGKISDKLKGGCQSLSAVTISGNFVCSGTTNATGEAGYYYGLNADTGELVWSYENTEQHGGYYWSGAAAGESTAGTYILFGGDNGMLISHSLSTAKVLDTYDLSSITGSQGKLRAGIIWDPMTKAYYTASNDGYLYRIQMNPDGTFASVTSAFFAAELPAANRAVNCTSTPTVWNGRLYVCGYYGDGGIISVFDAATLTPLYSVNNSSMKDIKSSPLISTGYATEENGKKAVAYFTQNTMPGGIYYLEDDLETNTGTCHPLYLPIFPEDTQYCLSSAAADSDGTLYYSNDSGTFFAIQEGYPAETDFSSPTPTSSLTPAPMPANTSSPTPAATAKPDNVKPNISPKNGKTKKPGKPKKIRVSVKRKSGKKSRIVVTVRWKKGKHTTKTKIMLGKKKLALTKAVKKTFVLPKGRHVLKFYGWQSKKKQSAPVRVRIPAVK